MIGFRPEQLSNLTGIRGRVSVQFGKRETSHRFERVLDVGRSIIYFPAHSQTIQFAPPIDVDFHGIGVS